MLSRQLRRLAKSYMQKPPPMQLEWIEINGIRGWTGQRIEFTFPIVAIVGENGAGKSTVIQAAASIYKGLDDSVGYFASDFFPDIPWESIHGAVVRASVRRGNDSSIISVRKPTTRWRGNPERKERYVQYLDLRRTAPIYARTGYNRLAKHTLVEKKSTDFNDDQLKQLSYVLGEQCKRARQSLTNGDPSRWVPVITLQGAVTNGLIDGDVSANAAGIDYSGFHQGAGENTIVDLMSNDFLDNSLVLIDEIETSLHPRAQRRLIRYLADQAYSRKLQVIVTTHSPYILEELPAEARVQVIRGGTGKIVVRGVSPEFAMTKMDDEQHSECDVYVEDDRAGILLRELLAQSDKDLIRRIEITPCGPASVGCALGQMVSQLRFRHPTVVFLDADQPQSVGCELLPGDDAPERVVFSALHDIRWDGVAILVGRSHSDLVDASDAAMLVSDHHQWVRDVADKLVVGGDDLWRAMCAVYVRSCLLPAEATRVTQIVRDAVDGIARGGKQPNGVRFTY